MKKLICTTVSTLATLALTAPVAMAEEVAGHAQGGSGLLGIGAGIAIGMAALGGTLGQGKTVSTLLDATGRNPGASGKLFVPMILGLVFIESLVIFSFVIAFQLIGKI